MTNHNGDIRTASQKSPLAWVVENHVHPGANSQPPGGLLQTCQLSSMLQLWSLKTRDVRKQLIPQIYDDSHDVPPA